METYHYEAHKLIQVNPFSHDHIAVIAEELAGLGFLNEIIFSLYWL